MTREEWVEKVQAEAITPVWRPPSPRPAVDAYADADAFIAEMERRRAAREKRANQRARRSSPGPHSLEKIA